MEIYEYIQWEYFEWLLVDVLCIWDALEIVVIVFIYDYFSYLNDGELNLYELSVYVCVCVCFF